MANAVAEPRAPSLQPGPSFETAKSEVWYNLKSPPRLSEDVISLFKSYPPTESISPALEDSEDPTSSPLAQHIIAIRTKAWAVFPFPCIGLYRFVYPNLSVYNRYPEILRRLKEDGARLLDLGCCVGQDIRRLVADGVPPGQLVEADLHQEFIDLGYELFRDGPLSSSPLSTEFVVGDIFDPSFLSLHRGKFDIINLGSFLHLFKLEKQKEASARIAELLSPKPGSLVIGKQLGSEQGRELKSSDGIFDVFWHSEGTFEEMWKGVGDGKWAAKAKLRQTPVPRWSLLNFVVERTA